MTMHATRSTFDTNVRHGACISRYLKTLIATASADNPPGSRRAILKSAVHRPVTTARTERNSEHPRRVGEEAGHAGDIMS